MDDQATRPKPRSPTEDYKRQVMDLVASSGRTPTAVVGKVGLHPTLLCRVPGISTAGYYAWR